MNTSTFAPSFKVDSALTNALILTLLKFYLLVDMANGFLVLGLGANLKLSVIYKSLILMLILGAWVSKNTMNLLYLLAFLLVFSLSEVTFLIMGWSDGHQLGFTIQHIIKLVTPFITFFYLCDLLLQNDCYANKIRQVIHVNMAIFVANIMLGIAGFGFSTYGGEVSDTSIGVKGFFYAGNEVSMLWVVFSSYLLAMTYNRGYRVRYLIMAAFTVIVGLFISTKTSILATFILILFIPIMIERSNLFNYTKGIAYLFLFFLLCLCVGVYVAIEFIQDSNLYGRLEFFFKKRGLIGILLSGRELFLNDLSTMMFNTESVLRILFGKGISSYAEVIKHSAELDLPDIFFWHGVIGVVTIVGLFIRMTLPAIKNCLNSHYPFAGAVLITNGLLFCISNISGHVFTSGMLGFLWAAFNALALCQYKTCVDAYS